jgi:hypothetical protein
VAIIKKREEPMAPSDIIVMIGIALWTPMNLNVTTINVTNYGIPYYS